MNCQLRTRSLVELGQGEEPPCSYFSYTNTDADTEVGRLLFPVTLEDEKGRSAGELDCLCPAESQKRNFGGHPEAHRSADGAKAAIHVNRCQGR